MSHILDLPALREDNPRDFLASLGLLKLLTLSWPDNKPRLSWSPTTGSPSIILDSNLPENWSGSLTTNLQSLVNDPRKPLRHGAVIRTTASTFRKAILKAVEFGDGNHPLALLPSLLYAAYASQSGDQKTGEVSPSAFSFGNGQSGKNLLLDVEQLILGLTADEFAIACAGCAKRRSAKTLRWQPAEFRPAAYRAHDPGAKVKGDEILDIPALNVLAFIGITYFPCVEASASGRTMGFFFEDGTQFFRWPIWDAALDDLEAFTILGVLVGERTGRPGLLRAWQSHRFSSDKSLYFAPAVRSF